LGGYNPLKQLTVIMGIWVL